jgi:stage II sporulation protein D
MPFALDRSPFRPMVLAAVVVLLAILGVAAGARPGTALADGPPPIPDGATLLGETVTIHGRGYGHGVGMSQHGARGRALDGATSTDILAHYFAGTTPGTIAPTTPIRVRVLDGFKATATRPLLLYGRRGEWRFDGSATVYPKDARIELRPTVRTTTTGTTATWRVRVLGPTGTVLRDGAIKSFRVRGTTSTAVFQVASRTSSYDLYRGMLRIGPSTTAPRASATNELSLERYLRGVVPAEMPSSWPTEALKAQAIAARSYAARRLRPGVSFYDVPDDTTSQVYLGVRGEKPTTTAAVTETAGVVLLSGSGVANTLFHSTGGGATEDNENVYVTATGAKVAGPVSYLRGSSDRREDGTAFDAASPRTNVGTITALDLRDRGVSGRLVSVTLIGSLGSKTVSGGVFRTVFNDQRTAGDPSMRSTLFDLQPVP